MKIKVSRGKKDNIRVRSSFKYVSTFSVCYVYKQKEKIKTLSAVRILSSESFVWTFSTFMYENFVYTVSEKNLK